MRRVWTLVAGTAVALGATAAPTPAAAAPTAPRSAGSNHAPVTDDGRDGGKRDGGRTGSVTAVSVVPATGRAEIVVAVDSGVDVQDFILSSPSRIVLDLTGATLSMPPRFYDKVSRGGVKNVRFAQYKADVVRVVVELDAAHKYELTRGARELRVSLAGGGSNFTAWHSGPALSGADAAATRASGEQPAGRLVEADELPVGSTAGRAAALDRSVTSSRKQSSASPAAMQQRQSSQPRITVTYQDADIRDVLAAFASFSGRTIVVGREVAGTVTAEIRDQPWDVALQAILQAQGLAASEDQYGIITVDSYGNILAKQSSEPLATQLISINYANASALVPTITSLLSRDCQGMAAPAAAGAPGGGRACVVRGTVSADTATNTLIVTEVPSRMNDVISYVRDLDVRTPQVAIKAKIIFVSRTDIEELGLSYDFGSSGTFFNRLIPRTDPATGAPYAVTVPGVVTLGGEALAGIANATRTGQSSAALNLVYSTMIGKFSLTAFLDALQEVRLSDTQAEPNIVTLDNRRAEILVGEETPIRVVDVGQGGGTAARSTTQFKESGIILSVTPHITNNRQIQMQVHAEQSQLQAAAADLGFTFLKRRADSQLLVEDGETAVIGGLTITQVTTSKSGIPFLVDLPLVGRLFGQTRTQEQKQDLLILITPHIIDEGEAVRSREPR